jgi:Flp pilus assembly pilin Flp
MYQRISLLSYRMLTVRLSDLKREEGQGITEYGLAVAFVAVALAGVLVLLSHKVSDFISKVGDDLANLPGNL